MNAQRKPIPSGIFATALQSQCLMLRWRGQGTAPLHPTVSCKILQERGLDP